MLFGTLTAAVAWFAIILQWYPTEESLTNFFSYFTILCNSLIAVSLTSSLLVPASSLGSFFIKVSVQSAIALYIFIVAVVYNTVLRGILTFSGWQLIVDNLLHVVVPILYILYWIFFTPKGRLQWKDGVYWIWFHIFYLTYSLIRGTVLNWYPYPFLNIERLGLPKVLQNIGAMVLVFLLVGLLIIAIDRLRKTKDKQY